MMFTEVTLAEIKTFMFSLMETLVSNVCIHAVKGTSKAKYYGIWKD